MGITHDAWRHLQGRIFEALCLLATCLGVGVLLWILLYVASKGIGALDVAFFTQLPAPAGESGGGVANAIVGTLIIVAIAAVIALPLGIGAGIYLAEFGENYFAATVRFVADVLTGVPSIVVGILAYQLVVVRMHRFSALAGGVALAALMLPPIVRTTEELIRLVPRDLTEAGLALGAVRWRVILRVVLRAASPGVVTGVMLALARAAGETAPLLFTAFGNNFWNTSLTQPMAALPLQIYQYAISPYDDWQRQAWGAAVVLVGLVLILSAIARAAVVARAVGQE